MSIDAATWTWLQDEARKNLAEHDGAAPSVIAHWRRIVDGIVPFGYIIS